MVLHAYAYARPDAARAFSDPFAYTDLPELGGGGGRWFTGSSADGYECAVCHRGGPAADLAISGLPADGFTPGAPYEITVTWPVETAHLALIAELTDEHRHGAGTLALPRPDALKPAELCSGDQIGFPASDLHQAEAGRQLVSVVDCGARMLRFKWTAPTLVTGPVWFDLGFVSSDADATAAGDGVTMVHEPLVAARQSLTTRVIAHKGCSVSLGARTGTFGEPALIATLLAVLRRRRNTHGRCN